MQTRSIADRRGQTGRGQSLTEVALGILLITVLLIGAIELGRVYLVYLSLQSAAGKAAEYGATAPLDRAGIVTRARGEALMGLIDWTGVAVTPTVVGQACAGGTMRVDAEYAVPVITPLLDTLLGRDVFLVRATVEAPILAPPC